MANLSVPSNVLEVITDHFDVSEESNFSVRDYMKNIIVKSPKLSSLVEERLIDDALQHPKKFLDPKNKKYIVKINQYLSPEELSRLRRSFGTYLIDNSSISDYDAHAFARAHRKLSVKFLLDLINYNNNYKLSSEYDVYVKDIGANPIIHLNMGNVDVHVCKPILGFQDDIRHSNFLEYLSNTNYNNLSKIQKKIFNNYNRMSPKHICIGQSQQCLVTSKYLLFIHSLYDITMQDIAKIMYRSRAVISYGCIIFHSDILRYRSGYIKEQDIHFSKYSRNNKNYIRFYFSNDPQLGYEHSWETYISILNTNRIVYPYGDGEIYYNISTPYVKDSVYFFKISKSFAPIVPKSTIFRAFDFPDNDYIVLYSWRFDTCYRPNLFKSLLQIESHNHMRPTRIVCKKKLFDSLMNYTMTLNDGRFLLKNVMNAAVAMNSRQVVGGATIFEPTEGLDGNSLSLVACAVYHLVYIQNYENSRLINILQEDEDRVRTQSFFTRTFLPKIFSNHGHRNRDGTRYHKLANTITKDCGLLSLAKDLVDKEYSVKSQSENSELNFLQELHNKLEHNDRRRYAPNRKFEIIAKTCNVMTFTEELDFIYNHNPNFPETVLHPDGLREIISAYTKEFVRDSFDKEVIEFKECNVIESEDSKNYITHKTRPDGNCFFHSVGRQLKINTPAKEKEIILNCELLSQFNEQEKESIISICQAEEGTIASYINESFIKIYCLYYDITITVHYSNSNKISIYNPNCKNNIHILYSGSAECGHFDYLEEEQKLNECLISELPNLDFNYEKFVFQNSRLIESLTAIKKKIFESGFSNINIKNARKKADQYGLLDNMGYLCRSGPKLAEILHRLDVNLSDIKCSVDICGGPGAFVQYLLNKTKTKIYGITKSDNIDYDPLIYCDRFFQINGIISDKFDSGDITILDNRNEIIKMLQTIDEPDLITADGATSDNTDNPEINEQLEILRSELDIILHIATEKTKIILKLFDITNITTLNIINIINESFHKTILIKPNTSRNGSSEFYIYAEKFLGIEGEIEFNNDEFSVEFNNKIYEFASVLLDNQLTNLLDIERILKSKKEFTFNLTRDKLKPYFDILSLQINDIRGGGFNFLQIYRKYFNDKHLIKPIKIKNKIEYDDSILDIILDKNTSKQKFYYNQDIRDEDVICSNLNKIMYINYPKYETEISTKEEVKPINDKENFEFNLVPVIEKKNENNIQNKESIIERIKKENKKLDERLDFLVNAVQDFRNDGFDKNFVKKKKSKKQKLSLIFERTINTFLPDQNIYKAKKIDKNLVPIGNYNSEKYFVNGIESTIEVKKNETFEEKLGEVEPFVHQIALNEYVNYLDAIIKTQESNHNRILNKLLMYPNNKFIISEERGNFGVIKDKEIYIKPKEYRNEYMKGFTKFGFQDYKNSLEQELVIISDYCHKCLDFQLIDSLKLLTIDKNLINNSDIGIIQAGPGTGKTTMIIKNHFDITTDKPSLVLLSTLEGKEDFINRVAVYKNLNPKDIRFKKYIRTIYSFVLNPDIKTDTLYIDEALMNHPGLIVAAIQFSGAKYVRLTGDMNQIPFVKTLATYPLKYSRLDSIFDIVDTLDTSYRCPKDVIYAIKDSYINLRSNLISASKIIHSVDIKKIISIEEVPKIENTQYLTFSQVDKQNLITHGYSKVSTVHEYQGKQNAKIIVVRLDRFEKTELFLRDEYALVAATRHTESLIYYTLILNDALGNLISKAKKYNDINGGGMIIPYRDNPTSISTLRFSTMAMDNIKRQPILFVPRIGYFEKYYRKKKIRMHEISTSYILSRKTIELVITEKISVSNLKFKIYSLSQFINRYYSECSEFSINFDPISHIDQAIISNIFYQSMPNIKFYFHTFLNYNNIHSNIFSFMNSNALSGIPNVKLEKIEIPTFKEIAKTELSPNVVITDVLQGEQTKEFGFNLHKNVVYVHSSLLVNLNRKKISKFIISLQKLIFGKIRITSESKVFDVRLLNLYSEIFPRRMSISKEFEHYFETFPSDLQFFLQLYLPAVTYHNRELDSWMVHNYDLELMTDPCRLRYLKFYKQSQYDTLRPTLSTPYPILRQVTTVETLLAVNKRNFQVPFLTSLVDYESHSQQLLNSLISGFDNEKYSVLVNEPIYISADDISEWLKTQDSSVVNLLEPDMCIDNMGVNCYDLMIKRMPKPDLTNESHLKYSALQTILAHPKQINALFCPVFKQIKNRICSILKDKIKIFCDVSVDDFSKELNFYISTNVKGMNSLEIDISKYDKSQRELALEFEIKLLKKFNVEQYFIDLWYIAHIITLNRDRVTGMKFITNYQRKSGDASTFIFNTLFLLSILLDTFEIDKLHMLLVAGDDSLIISKFDLKIDIQNFSNIYNLEIKCFTYDYYYFCSRFLLIVNGEWVLVPDPIKLLIKLGRTDLKNFSHMKEYHISFSDNVKNLNSDSVNQQLSLAVSERYNIYYNITKFLNILYNFRDVRNFSKLYYTLPSDNIDINATSRIFDI